jgi:ParB family chromosome partitioning protein
MQNYLALHRHAAVQNELADNPALALRVTVAHMIIGTRKWCVQTDAPSPKNEAIGKSIDGCFAKSDLSDRRKQILKLMNMPEHQYTLINRGTDEVATAEVLAHLITLTDAQVMDVMALAMAETLAADTPIVEAVGNQLEVNMIKYWQPEPTFFDLIREKPTINAILKEIGGKSAADGNVSSTGKAQKAIIMDFLEGRQGRKRVSGWMPKFMQFPFTSYTMNGGISIEQGWLEIAKLFTAKKKTPLKKATTKATPIKKAA